MTSDTIPTPEQRMQQLAAIKAEQARGMAEIVKQHMAQSVADQVQQERERREGQR